MLSLMSFPPFTRVDLFLVFAVGAPMCMSSFFMAVKLFREFRQRNVITEGAPWGAIAGVVTEDSGGGEGAGGRSQAGIRRRLA